MNLTLSQLSESANTLLQGGYQLPEYSLIDTRQKTSDAPVWVHFGVGNIFRAFPAAAAHTLLQKGLSDRGIIAVEGYDEEIVSKIYAPHDQLSILVTLCADGKLKKMVIGSVTESLVLDPASAPDEFSRLKTIFQAPSLQLATFTITEKGYQLSGADGTLFDAVAHDFQSGPDAPVSYPGKVAALLYARYQAGALPVAMVSMDNCSQNGDRLFHVVAAFADAWVQNGLAEPGFAAYLKDPEKVSFPWTMIDKITPRPDDTVKAMLEKDGFTDMEPVITSKSTYIAPFVNAEECEYLVLEDAFPNGRPPLEKAGFLFTDRETVQKTERMKVCTCLNPLHTALAVFGCLLGYHRIFEEMDDPDLLCLIEALGWKEGMPVVTNPGILNPEEFLTDVLKKRLPTPFLPDTPQRIATDTSQKLSVRFGQTILAWAKKDAASVKNLRAIPLVLAGWLRYLVGTEDSGQAFTPSPDPMLSDLTLLLQRAADAAAANQADEVMQLLTPLFLNTTVFGVDLVTVGLAKTVCSLFMEMCQAPGSVRKTLQRQLK